MQLLTFILEIEYRNWNFHKKNFLYSYLIDKYHSILMLDR